MNTKKGNNRSKEENERITAIARAARAQKQAAAKAKKAAKIAKVAAEYRHILSTPTKVIEKPLPIVTAKLPVSTQSVIKPVKKSNTGPAIAARREKYEARRAAREAKKALEQQIKQANREIREYTARQKKSSLRKKVGETFTFQDVLKGRLPDQYPYFVQVGDEMTKNRRARAKKITSDADVKRLLKKLETEDTRAKLVDIKKPKNISKPRPKQPKASRREEHIEQIAPAPLSDNIADQELNDFFNEITEEIEGGPNPADRSEASRMRDVLDSDLDDLPPREGEREGEREYDDYGWGSDYIDVDSPLGGGGGGGSFGYGGGGCTSVARSVAENCLLNIIRMKGNSRVDNVYEQFPELKPKGDGQPIYVDHDMIEKISRIIRSNITVYSALGAKINVPWHEFTYCNNRMIRVVFENGHAFLMKRSLEIDEIIYGPLSNIEDVEGLVVDHGYYRDPPTFLEQRYATGGTKQMLMYYVILHKGKYTMFKEYQPSNLTGNTADDRKESGNMYVFSDDQYLFRRFKKQFDLKTIVHDDMREIVKASEHFIGREIYMPVTEDLKIIDHNKNYMAYKSCGYYMGFPGNVFAASANPQPASSPYKDVFVAIRDMTNIPQYISRIFKYSSGSIVVPLPVYRYLTDIGALISVDYWVASTTKDIDIMGYAETIGIAGEKEKKDFRNSLVGRCITGGMKEKKGMTIYVANDREREQILYECATYNVDVTINADGSLTVYYEAKTKALYQFHSFILGYAAIHMMKKMSELEHHKCTLAGFNVDSIFYYGEYNSQIGANVGEWKYEKLEGKTILKRLKITEPTPFTKTTIPVPIHMEGFRYTRPTLIIGPPGIGKSHEFKTKPCFDQILTAPRKLLREEHKVGKYGFENTYTTHKYIQFSLDDDTLGLKRRSGKVPRIHGTHVVDEIFQFTKQQIKSIEERSGPNALRIFLGDPEQICNAIGGDAADVEWFKEKGYDIIELTRAPEMTCRHSYEDGCILDSLRGKNHCEQVSILSEHCDTVDNVMDIIPRLIDNTHYDVFVSDTHKKLHIINIYARDYCRSNNITFPVSDGKGNIIRVSADDPLIWWDRVSMGDVKPSELKYEPAFAVTGDSIQGHTISSKVYVHTNMRRAKVFYTAVTRTRLLTDIILVDNLVSDSWEPECTPFVDTKVKDEVMGLRHRLSCIRYAVKACYKGKSHYGLKGAIGDYRYIARYVNRIMNIMLTLKEEGEQTLRLRLQSLVQKGINDKELYYSKDGRVQTTYNTIEVYFDDLFNEYGEDHIYKRYYSYSLAFNKWWLMAMFMTTTEGKQIFYEIVNWGKFVRPIEKDNEIPTGDFIGPVIELRVNHPVKKPRTWTVKHQMKILKEKADFLTKIYTSNIDSETIETFWEYDAYKRCLDVTAQIARYTKDKEEQYEDARFVGKSIRGWFANKYTQLNKINIGCRTSNPINMAVYNELYKLSMKNHRKGNYHLALLYRSEGIFSMLLSIREDIYRLDPTIIKSQEQAKAIWDSLRPTYVAEEYIDELNI